MSLLLLASLLHAAGVPDDVSTVVCISSSAGILAIVGLPSALYVCDDLIFYDAVLVHPLLPMF